MKITGLICENFNFKYKNFNILYFIVSPFIFIFEFTINIFVDLLTKYIVFKIIKFFY